MNKTRKFEAGPYQKKGLPIVEQAKAEEKIDATVADNKNILSERLQEIGAKLDAAIEQAKAGDSEAVQVIDAILDRLNNNHSEEAIRLEQECIEALHRFCMEFSVSTPEMVYAVGPDAYFEREDGIENLHAHPIYKMLYRRGYPEQLMAQLAAFVKEQYFAFYVPIHSSDYYWKDGHEGTSHNYTKEVKAKLWHRMNAGILQAGIPMEHFSAISLRQAEGEQGDLRTDTTKKERYVGQYLIIEPPADSSWGERWRFLAQREIHWAFQPDTDTWPALSEARLRESLAKDPQLATAIGSRLIAIANAINDDQYVPPYFQGTMSKLRRSIESVIDNLPDTTLQAAK